MTGLALHFAAIFFATAFGTSLLVSSTMRAVSGRVAALDPAAHARWLLAALAAPLGAATLVVSAVAFPHQWLGLADHCLDHPGHLHLCLVHGAPAADAVVLTLSVLGAALALVRLGRSAIRAVRGAVAVGRVLAVARREGEVWVLPGEAPLAFTVGLLRPRVVVSAPVLASASRWRAVLEHERAHAEGRHPLTRWLAEMLTAFHLPRLGASLVEQLREAQERSADEHAAEAVGGRVEVAEALVEWMRWAHDTRHAVGFHSGPFEQRVRRLLDPAPSSSGPSARVLLAAAAGLGLVLGLGAPSSFTTRSRPSSVSSSR